MMNEKFGIRPLVTYGLLLILSTYFVIDISINHLGFPSLLSSCSVGQLSDPSPLYTAVDPSSLPFPNSDPVCSTREGYLEAAPAVPKMDPWRQMKWVGKPARCRVRGHLIESVDAANNFRRGFALRFAPDVEDRTHILPWLLGSRVDLTLASPRRVFLDLGANMFSTSILWFSRMYPCDFTEVHAFEVDRSLLKLPASGFNEGSNYAPPNQWSHTLRSSPGIPQWMLSRIHAYYSFVSDADDPASNAINITRFMKEELRLKPEDVVVIKMDIEGSEWPVLRRWMNDPEMSAIVDELFVEIHYDHPSMHGYHWARFAPTKREEAEALLADLRWHGFFAHFWP